MARVHLPCELDGQTYRIPLPADVAMVPHWGFSKLDPEDRVAAYREDGMNEEEIRFLFPDGLPEVATVPA